jgi:uncharacterized repeat protein (TIGR02543 family)
MAAVLALTGCPPSTGSKTYTVTFNTQGGSAVAAQKVSEGAKAARPATNPTKDGYVFGNWYREAAGTNLYSFDSLVTADITIYAKWTNTFYTVSFNTGEGGSAVSSQSVAAGGAATRPANPTRAGWGFVDWYTSAELTTAYDFATPVTGNITLYAKWSSTVFTVGFDAQGGSAVPSQTIGEGGKASRPTDPTRGGYDFDGWYKEADCTTAWNFNADTVSADITLYAKWTEVYTVSFDTAAGGSAVASQSVRTGGKVSRPATDPTRAGYVFDGWYTEAGCTTAWNFDNDTVSANITLYAKWITAYTVTFDSQGGSDVDSQSVGDGRKVTQPAAPTRDGYVFVNWYKEAVYTTLWDFDADTVIAPLTLYAKWRPFNTIAELTSYLASVTGGASTADPVPVAMGIDLAGNGWSDLLSAIQGKYVSLDLSACTMSGSTEFDPGSVSVGRIVSLTFPDAATSIKAGADLNNPTFKNFGSLRSVSGANITAIGNHAFDGSHNLTKVSLPKAAAIGEFAFYGCTALSELNRPEAVTIGRYSFYCCSNLPAVDLSNATDIGEYAFYECDALTTVDLPASLLNIVDNPFSDCTNLTTFTVASDNPNYSADGPMLFDKAGTTLIAYPSATGSVTLPAINSVGGRAFAGCTGLSEVHFTNATHIGWCAFFGCTALETISLPAATDINPTVFANCHALATVSLPSAARIGEGAFGYTGGQDLEITLGNTAPVVGFRMFSEVTVTKAVTVKVPHASAAAWEPAGYDANWVIARSGAWVIM